MHPLPKSETLLLSITGWVCTLGAPPSMPSWPRSRLPFLGQDGDHLAPPRVGSCNCSPRRWRRLLCLPRSRAWRATPRSRLAGFPSGRSGPGPPLRGRSVTSGQGRGLSAFLTPHSFPWLCLSLPGRTHGWGGNRGSDSCTPLNAPCPNQILPFAHSSAIAVPYVRGGEDQEELCDPLLPRWD